MKYVIITAIFLVVLGYTYYDYDRVKPVATLRLMDGLGTVDVLNTLQVSLGDTVLVEKCSLTKTNHQVFIISQLSSAPCHFSHQIGNSTYYRMINKEIKSSRINWVIKGTPPDSLWESGSIEGRYTSLLETVSGIKGVVIRKKKGGL